MPRPLAHRDQDAKVDAEGSLSTQRMVIYQMADWEKYKAVAKRALGIPFDHPELNELPTEPPWKTAAD